MTQIQRKSLLFIFPLIIGLVSIFATSLQALPERYTIISQKILPDFYFFEDQPWVNPPQKINFNNLVGKHDVIVLHFWSTSSPSCIDQLDQLEKTAKGLMNQPIKFMPISVRDPRSGVLRNFFNRKHYSHIKPYHNPSRKRPKIKGLPTTFFINKKGQLIGKIEGPIVWDAPEMIRLLNRLSGQEHKKETKIYGLVDKFLMNLKKVFVKKEIK